MTGSRLRTAGVHVKGIARILDNELFAESRPVSWDDWWTYDGISGKEFRTYTPVAIVRFLAYCGWLSLSRYKGSFSSTSLQQLKLRPLFFMKILVCRSE